MKKAGKRALFLVCFTAMFGQPALAEEWFEKRDATTCVGTIAACMPELEALGWGFVGPTDKHRSRSERRTETWAKGRQIIVCQWRKDGSPDVTCELTSFDD
jgi:hypothetical protein